MNFHPHTILLQIEHRQRSFLTIKIEQLGIVDLAPNFSCFIAVALPSCTGSGKAESSACIRGAIGLAGRCLADQQNGSSLFTGSNGCAKTGSAAADDDDIIKRLHEFAFFLVFYRSFSYSIMTYFHKMSNICGSNSTFLYRIPNGYSVGCKAKTSLSVQGESFEYVEIRTG